MVFRAECPGLSAALIAVVQGVAGVQPRPAPCKPAGDQSAASLRAEPAGPVEPGKQEPALELRALGRPLKPAKLAGVFEKLEQVLTELP